MNNRVLFVALGCLVFSGAALGGDGEEKQAARDVQVTLETILVRGFVAGRVVLSDDSDSREIGITGSTAIQRSASSDAVLFGMVGGGYVPAGPDHSSSPRVTDERDKLKKDSNEGLPLEYALFQNYPNPFNPSTTIRFELPEESSVTITIYDVLGRTLLIKAEQRVAAGRYGQVWDARTGGGIAVASGVYFCRVEARSLVSLKSMQSILKMVLMK